MLNVTNITINIRFHSFVSFFNKSSKKEAGISFILLPQSRNTIGRLMKTYLYKPIKILYFLPAEELKNISHKTLKYSFVFSSICYLHAESRIFYNVLFLSQWGFRKGYSTQHCLLVLTEKFKEAFHKGNFFSWLTCPKHLLPWLLFIGCKTILVWVFAFIS